MIEFGLKHSHSSGWHKKFPRHKINIDDSKHLGMAAHLKFNHEWRSGRNGYLSWKDIDKFLEANIGKNVDSVFSEFIKRAKRFNHEYNLREEFYRHLNLYSRCNKGYCLDSQNRIIKKQVVPRYAHLAVEMKNATSWNEAHYPKNVTKYLNDWGYTYLGEFYIRIGYRYKIVPIYIVSAEWLNFMKNEWIGKPYIKAENMIRVKIQFNNEDAKGVSLGGWTSRRIPTGKYECINNFMVPIYDFKKYPYSVYCDSPWIFVTPRDPNLKYWSVY